MTATVREARPDETLAVRRLLDAAMLERGDVEAGIEAGDVLVAVEPREPAAPDGPGPATDGAADDRVLGALVLEPLEGGARVAAIAVRRRRRDRGIGTALVTAALEREGRLAARFDDGVAPFYESLGFAIEPIDESGRRLRGVRAVAERESDPATAPATDDADGTGGDPTDADGR